jgi:uncharacterized damage-inducible protein DinB
MRRIVFSFGRTDMNMNEDDRPPSARAAVDPAPAGAVGCAHPMSATEASRLAEFARAVRESTLKRLRRVPPGSENWRIHGQAMSFADLARHIAEADRWLLEKLGDPSLPAMTGRAHLVEIAGRREYQALLEELEETGRQRAALLESMTADRLSQKLPDERFGGAVSTWWVIVRGNLDHEIHHRGQIAAFLRIVQRGGPP